MYDFSADSPSCSVAILIFNKTRKAFVMVRQFRPGECVVSQASQFFPLPLKKKKKKLARETSECNSLKTAPL